MALNVDGDLSPFARINPCGYAGMQVTRLTDLAALSPEHQVGEQLAKALAAELKRELISIS